MLPEIVLDPEIEEEDCDAIAVIKDVKVMVGGRGVNKDGEDDRTVAAVGKSWDRIRIQFWVDESRFLRLTVEDLLTLETLMENQVVVQLS